MFLIGLLVINKKKVELDCKGDMNTDIHDITYIMYGTYIIVTMSKVSQIITMLQFLYNAMLVFKYRMIYNFDIDIIQTHIGT